MTGKVQRTSVEQRGRQKGNKCLNYVAGEKASVRGKKTWSRLKDFTARINLRDVSSPSACVALGPLHQGSQRWSVCYFRATDNTPLASAGHQPPELIVSPLAVTVNPVILVTSLRDQNLTNELCEPAGSKERSADTTDGTWVLILRISSSGLSFYNTIPLQCGIRNSSLTLKGVLMLKLVEKKIFVLYYWSISLVQLVFDFAQFFQYLRGKNLSGQNSPWFEAKISCC